MYYNASNMPCQRQTAGAGMFPLTASPSAPALTTNGMQQGQPLYPVSPTIGTIYPTGIPVGTQISPVPTPPTIPTVLQTDQGPETVASIQYTPGFLKTQIGRRVKVEFLIGTNMLVDREGTLLAVGASYIIIQETDTDDMLLCDLYSIKFARFYY